MTKKDFDRQAYKEQIRSNQLIGILLSLSAIALLVIILIICNALQ